VLSVNCLGSYFQALASMIELTIFFLVFFVLQV